MHVKIHFVPFGFNNWHHLWIIFTGKTLSCGAGLMCVRSPEVSAHGCVPRCFKSDTLPCFYDEGVFSHSTGSCHTRKARPSPEFTCDPHLRTRLNRCCQMFSISVLVIFFFVCLFFFPLRGNMDRFKQTRRRALTRHAAGDDNTFRWALYFRSWDFMNLFTPACAKSKPVGCRFKFQNTVGTFRALAFAAVRAFACSSEKRMRNYFF